MLEVFLKKSNKRSSQSEAVVMLYWTKLGNEEQNLLFMETDASGFNKKKYILIMVVWGGEYTQFFLDFGMASLLATGNIPQVAQNFDFVLHIYTTAEDGRKISGHPLIQKASEYISIECFHVLNKESSAEKNKYDMRSFCISLAIEKAKEMLPCVLLLGSPDVIWGENSLSVCCFLIESGYDVVNVAALNRVSFETLVPALKQEFHTLGTTSLEIANRALIALGIEHLHRVGYQAFWQGKLCNLWPSMMYWEASKKSLVGKFFHFQPLAIHLRNCQKAFPKNMTDDGGLIEWLGIERKCIYTVTTTDEIALLEVSRDHPDLFPAKVIKNKTFFILQWAYKFLIPEHCLNFVRYTIRYIGENEPISWNKVYIRVFFDTFILRIFLSLKYCDPHLIVRALWRNFFSKSHFFQKRKVTFVKIFQAFVK